MSNVLAALKTEARLVADEHEILTHLNNLIAEQVEPGRFVTFFYGVIDRRRKILSYACAGHNPSLRLSADGEARWLSEAGVPLGILPDNVYTPAESAIEVGDVIVLYSDGVTEAERPPVPSAPPDRRTGDGGRPSGYESEDGGEGDRIREDDRSSRSENSGGGGDGLFEELESEPAPDFFGERRLEETVRRARHLSAAGIVQAVVEAVHEFTGGADLSDDLTLVVVKIEEDSPAA
jgi:serine phosphatase RsbU (regulator of sigma subunit)